MSEEHFDASVPSQMAERAKASGIRKAKRDFLSALFLAIRWRIHRLWRRLLHLGHP